MQRRNFLILNDHHDFFATSLPDPQTKKSLDVYEVKTILEKNNFNVEILPFHLLELNKDYKDYFILYASSESAGGLYKNFIDDYLSILILKGSILIPSYNFFKSHHNKVFMEMYRSQFVNENLKTISSKYFYDISDLMDTVDDIQYPSVLKPASGAGSIGVKLVNNKQELLKGASEISHLTYRNKHWTFFRSNPYMQKLKNFYRTLTKKTLITYPIDSEKFVVQNYIPGMKGDYKVLVFNNKFYPLLRENSKGSFTASGSGNFSFVTLDNEVDKVLDFAVQAYDELRMPMASLDIGISKDNCHLLEFQCVYFGPLALQQSPGWFENHNNKWVFFEGKSSLEIEFVASVLSWVEREYNE